MGMVEVEMVSFMNRAPLSRTGMANFLPNFQMTEGRMIIYVVFVCEEILTVHFILTFFHIYAVLMLISTAILKIRVKSLYEFKNLDHLFQ